MDWEALRDEMPVTRNWAFFDHAAVAPIPRRAQQAISEWATDIAANGGVHERAWLERVEGARRLAGRLINADPLDVAFVKNTTEGIGFVAEGFPWRPGDNLVTAQDEYPSNLYPWMNLASRGVEVRTVPSHNGRIRIDDIRAAMDERTRLVSLSWVEFASGFRNDLDAIGSLCRERGAYFFVDAIQGLGVFPLDVGQTPIDFLSADGHKWLLGPEAAGVFYIRRELIDLLHPIGVGWSSVVGWADFSRIDFRLKPHAGRWEGGTLNIPGIIGLGASLEWLLGLGIDNIGRRVLELTDHLCDQAGRAGVEVFSSRRPDEKSSLVSLVVPDTEPREVVRRCREQGIVVNQRGGRVRVSPHCYNTMEELDRLVAMLSRGTRSP